MKIFKDVRLYIAVLFICVFSLPIAHHYHEKQKAINKGLVFAGFAVGGYEYTRAMLRQCMGFSVDMTTGKISDEWNREIAESYWRKSPDFCQGAVAAHILLQAYTDHIENGTPDISAGAVEHFREMSQ